MDTATWKQPFEWGVLLAFDDGAKGSLPAGIGAERIVATATCVAVPVLHAQDVEIPDDWPDDQELPPAEVEVSVMLGAVPANAEWVGPLDCPTGRLSVGDANSSRVLDVPSGRLTVAVSREPVRYAERVTITLTPGE